MIPAADDDFDWFKYDDELVLSAEMLQGAKTPWEVRRALKKWLRSTAAVLSDQYGDETTAPATLLLAGLETLEGGTAPEFLRVDHVASLDRSSPSARARAVVAVNVMVRAGAKPREAIDVVSRICGIPSKALKGLRAKVNSKNGQKGVLVIVEQEYEKMKRAVGGNEVYHHPWDMQIRILVSLLSEDRIIHTHLRR